MTTIAHNHIFITTPLILINYHSLILITTPSSYLPLPHLRTGIYKWYVSLDNHCGKRGNCIIGVATAELNSDLFLGQDGEGWGLSTNKELFHGGEKLCTDYGHKLSRSGVIEVTLDTDKGTLSFNDRDHSHGNYGIAFTGLNNGLTLFPAFSLYSAEDSITVLPGPRDSSSSGRGGSSNTPGSTRSASSSSRKSYSSPSTRTSSSSSHPSATHELSLSRAPSPKGIPPPALIILLLDYTAAATVLLEDPRAVMHPLISINLVQLLAALSRWQRASVFEAKAVFAALNGLLQTLRQAVIRARQNTSTLPTVASQSTMESGLLELSALDGSGGVDGVAVESESGSSSTPAATTTAAADDTLVLGMLVEVACVVSSYIGLITCGWVKGHGDFVGCCAGVGRTEVVDNHTLALLLQQERVDVTGSTTLPLLLPPSSNGHSSRGHILAIAHKTQYQATARQWAKSALVANGPFITATDSGKDMGRTLSPLAMVLVTANDNITFEDTVGGRQLVQWLELHDPTHQNLQRMGGVALVPAVRALFAVNLHHSGYLHAASTLATRLSSLAADTEAWERIREAKPPSFLLSAWEQAMKLRVGARSYFQRLVHLFPDMDMPRIATAIVNRCRFLLYDLEAWKSDQIVDGPLSGDLSTWLINMNSEKFTTSFLPSMNELHTVCTTTLSFILNPWTSVPHLRATMRAGQARALCRREGLKAVCIG